MVASALGVFFGNALLVIGALWLAIRLYTNRQLSRIRHVTTGEPIPSPDFFEQMGLLFGLGLGLFPGFSPLEQTLENRAKYGPTFAVWQAWKPLVFLTLHDDVHTLLTDKEDKFLKSSSLGANPTLPRVMGTSLIVQNGAKWKEQRRAMDPSFQYKKIRTLVPLFARCVSNLIQKWERQKQQPLKVEEDLTRMTLDAMGLGLFSYNFGAVEEVAECGTYLNHYHNIIGAVFRPLAFLFPVVAKLPTSYNIALEKSIQDFQAFLVHVIQTHKEGKPVGAIDVDLLDHIIAMDQEGKLTDEEISHNLFLFFLAGHDTTASSLTASLYFFAKFPHMQEQAYQEVKNTLGDKDSIELDDLSKLSYLTMFIKETLRMRPPVGSGLARKVNKDGVVLGGYHIPKGTAVTASIWAAHYDSMQWPDPHTFKPERFADEDKVGDILTFSAGPRICIGKKFAMAEMLTTLSMLLQKFEFELVHPDYEWRFKPISITLRPQDGMPLRVKQRRETE